MSEITMKDFPNELVIGVLERLLDSTSLNNAVMSCKLWKQLIECSCTWSILVLNQENHNEQWINYCQTTNRKFHTIEINGLVLIRNDIVIEIFKRLGSKVVQLVLNDSCLETLDLFVEMLKYLPNLEHIILNGVTTFGDVSNVPCQHDVPELNKLKTLEISRSTYSYMLCLTRSQLETLKIDDSSNVYPNKSMTAVTDLLRSQPQLTTFALRGIDYDTCELFRTEILNGGDMQFRHTKVSLIDIEMLEIDSQNGYKNLLTFLKHHAKTMKELELGQKFSNSIYELVFPQFENLKTLQLMVNELPNEMAFYDGLAENRSINNLIITDSPPRSCPQSLKEFIRHVPNITNLTLLANYSRETLVFMAKNLTKVQELAVKYFNGFSFERVHFPKLTTLNIRKLNEETDWDRFTKDNSQITELTIEIVDDREALRCNDVKRIIENLKLHTLKIGRNFFPSSDCFEHIRQKCFEMKKLYFHEVCKYIATEQWKEGEGDNKQPQERFGDIPGLRFCNRNCMATSSESAEIWNFDESDFGSEFEVTDDEIDYDEIDYDEIDDDEIDDDEIDDDGLSISDIDGESMIYGYEGESMMSDNDGESMMSDNDGESMISDNDGESMMSDYEDSNDDDFDEENTMNF